MSHSIRTRLLPALLLAAACGGGDLAGAGGEFGATPGGVKDLTLARDLIAEGLIPPADALLVEAMFAEHELGLEGEPCARTLCLRAAAGFASELDGQPRGWAQVGMSSTIDLETWSRPSTTFVFTVDVSGSMGWEYVDEKYPSGGQLARAALHALTDELRPDDRIAIVTYGSSVTTELQLSAADDLDQVHRVIDRLGTNGSTNMEAGLERSYAIASEAAGSTEQVRVILFSDEQPNVGATEPSQFEEMVAGAAVAGVHTTVLGLGLGLGPEVMRAMASLRGANAFSLTRLDHVTELMADDYPWFTTPIAYDLRVDVALEGGWSIERGLGFPAADDESAIGLKADTVFLSRRKGALLVALEAPGGSPAGLAGHFTLRYRDVTGGEVDEQTPFAYDDGALDERGQWFAQHGVARTTALALFTEGMHAAAAAYAESAEEAESIMRAAQERFAADAEALGDDDLPVEVQLGAALLELIESRAEQGTFYPE